MPSDVVLPLARLSWPRRTARLLLRPLTVADAPAALGYRGDPEATRHLSHPPLTLAQVTARHEDRVRRMAPRAAEPLLALAVERGDEVIGDCVLRPESEAGVASIGYAFATAAAGNGYATEATRELVEIARELGFRGLVATTRATNVASQRVLVKAGFVPQPARDAADARVFRRDLR